MADKERDGLAYPDLQDRQEVYEALLNYGMFAKPQLPPCFTSEGLSDTIKKIRAKHHRFEGEANPSSYRKDYIRYSAHGHTMSLRDFGIPHPIAYHNLCSAIKAHWALINKKCYVNFKKNFCHVRKIEGEHSIFDMDVGSANKHAAEDMRVRHRVGAKFKVKADISKCFPSTYTHAIAWAVATKEVVKKHRDQDCSCPKDCKCSECLEYKAGNQLDRAAQNTTKGETNGLLIGPHASNILSELILCRIDRELTRGLLHTNHENKYIRHIDDYEFFAVDEHTKEEFILTLRQSLSKYNLSLNESKGILIEIPETEIFWTEKMRQFKFPPFDKWDPDPDAQAEPKTIGFTSIDAYLKLAVTLSKKHKSTAPLKYAVKVLAAEEKDDDGYHINLNLSSRAALNAAIAIFGLCLTYPYLCPYVEKVVGELQKFMQNSPSKLSQLDDELRNFVQKLLEISVEKSHTDAIAYSFYFAKKYDIQIRTTSVDLYKIFRLDDCIALTLLHAYASSNRNTLNISIWEDYVVDRAIEKNESKQEQDKFWLLIYQCLSAEQIKDPWLRALKEEGFKFIDWGKPAHSSFSSYPSSDPASG